jgi:hypothetical protein
MTLQRPGGMALDSHLLATGQHTVHSAVRKYCAYAVACSTVQQHERACYMSNCYRRSPAFLMRVY